MDGPDGKKLFWSESHVSEDFDISLRLQCAGNVVRLGCYHQDGFKEGVSLTVYDELARWEKYDFFPFVKSNLTKIDMLTDATNLSSIQCVIGLLEAHLQSFSSSFFAVMDPFVPKFNHLVTYFRITPWQQVYHSRFSITYLSGGSTVHTTNFMMEDGELFCPF